MKYFNGLLFECILLKWQGHLIELSLDWVKIALLYIHSIPQSSNKKNRALADEKPIHTLSMSMNGLNLAGMGPGHPGAPLAGLASLGLSPPGQKDWDNMSVYRWDSQFSIWNLCFLSAKRQTGVWTGLACIIWTPDKVNMWKYKFYLMIATAMCRKWILGETLGFLMVLLSSMSRLPSGRDITFTLKSTDWCRDKTQMIKMPEDSKIVTTNWNPDDMLLCSFRSPGFWFSPRRCPFPHLPNEHKVSKPNNYEDRFKQLWFKKI